MENNENENEKFVEGSDTKHYENDALQTEDSFNNDGDILNDDSNKSANIKSDASSITSDCSDSIRSEKVKSEESCLTMSSESGLRAEKVKSEESCLTMSSESGLRAEKVKSDELCLTISSESSARSEKVRSDGSSLSLSSENSLKTEKVSSGKGDSNGETDLNETVEAISSSESVTNDEGRNYLKVKDMSGLYENFQEDAAKQENDTEEDGDAPEVETSQEDMPDLPVDSPSSQQQLEAGTSYGSEETSRKRKIIECSAGNKCLFIDREHFMHYSHRHLTELLISMEEGGTISSAHQVLVSLETLHLQLQIVKEIEFPPVIDISDSDEE